MTLQEMDQTNQSVFSICLNHYLFTTLPGEWDPNQSPSWRQSEAATVPPAHPGGILGNAPPTATSELQHPLESSDVHHGRAAHVTVSVRELHVYDRFGDGPQIVLSALHIHSGRRIG